MDGQPVEVPREIRTERLLLHTYRVEDAETVIEAVDESRAEVGRWKPWVPYLREAEQSRTEARRSWDRWEAREDFALTIRRTEDNRFLGGTGLHSPDWTVPSFEIGYWIRTSEAGKGYVSEAVRGLLRVAFGVLGAKRVEIFCDEGNIRSIRVAEVVGCQLEGRLRNEDRLPSGELGNTLVYSLIDTDEATRHLVTGQPPAVNDEFLDSPPSDCH
jgi:RimJ/RimL family protein N-acetyltransferase